ncbi:aspartic peptidase domain-containing protein [Suillus subaureus]|uniref:Aspartic peptidase domain-containing protein n=1 Tax=Suillus subaureus TaxID=48587 RepID=A0A9P7JGD1_9AGAM|nr:aspartic peptidase domain-containing protein [Suillus subaureus]KAG1820843.1 aspartic peptidase domain-containing protein [Suillus subaureus]
MVPSRSLSPLLALPALAFLSLSASALPHARAASSTAALKLAVRINSYGIKNIAAADRARIQTLQAGGSSSVNATNDVMIYTADIGVGSPATYYTLLIDTGSSNTWIGANKAYVPTSTSHDTGGTFYVTYGDNSYVSGEEYTDTVTLNSDLVIDNQSIGVASKSDGMGDLDGILGVGPVDLTEGTVSNADEVPTVTDNLYAQKKISSEVLGVFFAPASSDDSSGELTFGGYDASKITGGINYVPITSTSPASDYWGIDQSISYGSKPILDETAGIVDTGTTLILIASDAFAKYQAATGATLDETTGLLEISSEQYDQLSSLYFTIGGVTYELTPNGQIWPRSLNSAIEGTTDGIYLIVSSTGSLSGSGLDFTNGYCFLERFYSVYDTTNSRVGFATTKYTYATTN